VRVSFAKRLASAFSTPFSLGEDDFAADTYDRVLIS
jgi:hypothetical protein